MPQISMAVTSLIQTHQHRLTKEKRKECVTRQLVVNAESHHGLDAVSILKSHSRVYQKLSAARVTRMIPKSQASSASFLRRLNKESVGGFPANFCTKLFNLTPWEALLRVKVTISLPKLPRESTLASLDFRRVDECADATFQEVLLPRKLEDVNVSRTKRSITSYPH